VLHCKDDPPACSELGNLYMSGTGVDKDIDLGSVLLDLACKHRDAQACRELEMFREATR
jgi:TPR repeat protein